jgi:hypothetical protein
MEFLISLRSGQLQGGGSQSQIGHVDMLEDEPVHTGHTGRKHIVELLMRSEANIIFVLAEPGLTKLVRLISLHTQVYC